MLAYLVIREGTKWTDVYRLVPGRTVTIGRAATNQIVIKDERASRNHAEVFLTQGKWTVRDLESRNGTFVGERQVHGDCSLEANDIVRIAQCQLAYVHDLSQAFAATADDATATIRKLSGPDETVMSATPRPSLSLSDSSVLDGGAPAHITHRRGQTRFLAPSSDLEGFPKVGKAATKLCRLAFELASQTDVLSVAKLAITGLFEGTNIDAGGVWLLPNGHSGPPTSGDLQLVASRTDLEPSYHRVSSFLADTVLRDGEAVLARNIEDDSTLGSRDSKGEIHSTSVICAPIRQDKVIAGLIHMYSTSTARIPDPDDLEFTLAVADNVALALKNLARQQELAENLSHTQSEVVQLRKRLGAESELVGSSPLLANVQQQVARAAPSRATVLIRGESGVGKELIARVGSLHEPAEEGAVRVPQLRGLE